MLLTGKQLAMKFGVHITTIRRACRNDHIPYERLGKLYFFDLDRVREAMQKNGKNVLTGDGGLRATGGKSRRRAQPTRPRLGKTGASIAQRSIRELNRRPNSISGLRRMELNLG